MTNAVSRILIAAVLAPVVLGAVYFGGWWVFGLAAFAAAVGLHEYWLMARQLRPLAPAGYIGVILGLVGAQLGGAKLAARRDPGHPGGRLRPEGDLRGAAGGDDRDRRHRARGALDRRRARLR